MHTFMQTYKAVRIGHKYKRGHNYYEQKLVDLGIIYQVAQLYNLQFFLATGPFYSKL